MKLAAKLVAIFLIGIYVLTAIRVFYAIRHETDEFSTEVASESEHIVLTMREVISDLGHDWEHEVAVRQVALTAIKHADVEWRYLGEDELPKHVQDLTIDGRPKWYSVPDGQGAFRACSYWPYFVRGRHCGWIEFSKPLAELRQNQRNAVYRNIWVAGATAIMAILLVAVVGVRLVGRPVEVLVEKTRRIAKGDLSGPIKLNSRDEFSELAESINDMCEQLQESQQRLEEEAEARVRAVEQLRHTDRLRTVGRLGAGVAHELGTPLNVVSGRAALIASGKLSEEDVKKSAGTIKAEADRMTAIIRKLLDFARRNTPQRSVVDLHQLARETSDLLTSIAKKKGVQIDVQADAPPLSASVDRGQMQQVLTNLIMNAVQAMPEGGQVDVEVRRTRAVPPPEAEAQHAGEGDYIRIAVTDEGPGIPAEILDQVFEPFFTTKQVGEGTGLGLSIAHGIVHDHGGWIDVASEPSQGTCFAVYLPGESPA